MNTLSRSQFDREVEAFDATVATTDDIDHFCSSSAWILPANDAFYPNRECVFLSCDEGYSALAFGVAENGARYMAPLEAMWGLASPIAGDDQHAVAQQLAEALRKQEDQWDLLWLCGIKKGSSAYQSLVQAFGKHYQLGLGPTATRHSANIEGGIESFLARRSPRFRRNMRRAQRQAHVAGLDFNYICQVKEREVAPLYKRILRIEAKSHKGADASGILLDPMRSFYAHMLPRLARRGSLRALFATMDGHDVAYVFGGVMGTTYRGLQMSFDQAHGSLSPGNLVQGAMIDALAEEGVRTYDLGSDIDYKRRWADGGLETAALVVVR